MAVYVVLENEIIAFAAQPVVAVSAAEHVLQLVEPAVVRSFAGVAYFVGFVADAAQPVAAASVIVALEYSCRSLGRLASSAPGGLH